VHLAQSFSEVKLHNLILLVGFALVHCSLSGEMLLENQFRGVGVANGCGFFVFLQVVDCSGRVRSFFP
jgi:hypothetical protein